VPAKRFLCLKLIALAGAWAALCPPGFAQEYSPPDANRLGAGPMAPVQTPALPDFSALPSSPATPASAVRPSGWPGAPATPAGSPSAAGASPKAPEQIESNWEFCEGTQILAIVGTDAVFAYEIMDKVNQVLDLNKKKIPPWEVDQVRTQQIQLFLKEKIETKLVFLDAKRNIPAEGITQTEKKLEKYFDEQELPVMKKKSKAATDQELDDKLRSYGGSLERVRKAFVETSLAQIWAREKFKAKEKEEVTYDEMLDYYHQHLADFETPARAKWEEIVVRFDKYPNKQAAYDALVALGNQIFHGVPFAQVAKTGSDGITAADGGLRDWVSRGSLVDEQLDRAVFGLPVGQFSPILEGDDCYYIVRVTERTEKQTVPFETAQLKIGKKIKDRRLAQQQKDYLAELERQTPIWTIFDNPEGVQQISQRRPNPRR
jgi:parvulin-like peptidyl-prolyl isomerase